MKHKAKNIFLINFDNFNFRNYGVSVKYFKAEEPKPFKRIDYEASIALSKHELGWIMSLDKKEAYFNQHEPDSISERFGAVISESLYPVQTVIDGWGKQVTAITNREVVQKRWKKNKQKIAEKYEGNVVDDFINIVEKKIASSSLIQQSMQYDWFWNLFFHPKYMSYGDQFQQPMDLYLSVIPYRPPIRFGGMQRIVPEITEYGSVVIRFKSEEQDVPGELLTEKEDGEDTRMQLDVEFDLDKEHHFAMHTKAVLKVYEREGSYIKKPIKKIQFTMYQL